MRLYKNLKATQMSILCHGNPLCERPRSKKVCRRPKIRQPRRSWQPAEAQHVAIIIKIWRQNGVAITAQWRCLYAAMTWPCRRKSEAIAALRRRLYGVKTTGRAGQGVLCPTKNLVPHAGRGSWHCPKFLLFVKYFTRICGFSQRRTENRARFFLYKQKKTLILHHIYTLHTLHYLLL